LLHRSVFTNHLSPTERIGGGVLREERHVRSEGLAPQL
jgi:hypothetical protein